MLTNETDRMLADGGIMQQGDTVDPVSGNDVPPGAMQEEVRDDIDAKLSEGEFVLPADVVRYIGLSTLMKMRDKAKEGLQKMEDIGQMGNAEEVEDAESPHGEESEMDDSSFGSEIDSILSEDSGGGEEREYAEGGYVVPERQALYRNAPIRGFEMVPMSNDLGQTIYIPFINGVAQLNVPEGYKPKSSVAAGEPVAAAPTTPAVVAPAAGGGGDSGDGGGDGPSGNTDGTAAGGGQGISNTAISAGLASMAFGQSLAGRALSAVLGVPLSTVANIGGRSVVDQQMEAISKSFDAMSSVDTGALAGQIGTVSDASGNISTVSNQSITDAFDMANFGVTSSQVSADSAANASQAAETGMTTNEQGQTVSSDASIAAQDAANFGGGGGDSASSAGMGGASEGSAGSTAATSDSPDGPDGSNASGGGGGGGDSKIVCTAMNEQYGFGSFRNSVWLKYSESNMTKAHEVGYHTMFLPLVDFAFKQGDGKLNMVTRKLLENVARHRSLDLRAEMRGTKRDPVGMVYRSVLEPLCYIVGKLKGY